MGPTASADSILETVVSSTPALAGVDIVYEGTNYKPQGKAYVVLNNMHAGSTPGVADAPTRYTGIFQVSVYSPDGFGAGPGVDLVDAILGAFKGGLSFTNGKGVLYVLNATRENSLRIPSWLQLPISVNWFMYY